MGVPYTYDASFEEVFDALDYLKNNPEQQQELSDPLVQVED